jgi:hypothetical protein
MIELLIEEIPRWEAMMQGFLITLCVIAIGIMIKVVMDEINRNKT